MQQIISYSEFAITTANLPSLHHNICIRLQYF